jgi:hypothetical protein
MDVRCENFREDVKGGLRGFCDLVIQPHGVRLLSCKLFRSGAREWVEFPSRQYESQGKKRWARTVDFTTGCGYREFQTAALEAIRKFRFQSKQPAEPIRSGVAG